MIRWMLCFMAWSFAFIIYMMAGISPLRTNAETVSYALDDCEDLGIPVAGCHYGRQQAGKPAIDHVVIKLPNLDCLNTDPVLFYNPQPKGYSIGEITQILQITRQPGVQLLSFSLPGSMVLNGTQTIGAPQDMNRAIIIASTANTTAIGAPFPGKISPCKGTVITGQPATAAMKILMKAKKPGTPIPPQ